MYYLKTEGCFDSAHFLKNYNGKCKNIHGHRWRVVARLASETLSQDGEHEGMLVDFSELKEELSLICDELDHCFIYERGSLMQETLDCFEREGFKVYEVDFRPTAENFSRFIFDRLKKDGYCVDLVEVYETPNNYAAYAGGQDAGS